MRFTLLVPFVLASPVFRHNEPGLLDGILGGGNNDDGLMGGLLGDDSRRNNDVLGHRGLLGTGIGGSRGLLLAGLLGNNDLGSRHCRHARQGGRHGNYYADYDYNNEYYGDDDYYDTPKINYGY